MESNARTTSSTAAPHVPLGRELPVAPGSRAAEIRAGIDAWDGRIPTAPKTATLTREQLDREIAAAKTHEPYLIGSSSDSLDRIGEPYAWGAL